MAFFYLQVVSDISYTIQKTGTYLIDSYIIELADVYD